MKPKACSGVGCARQECVYSQVELMGSTIPCLMLGVSLQLQLETWDLLGSATLL